MTQTGLSSGFLSHFQQHWPFPSPLPECTLISSCFNEKAVSEALFTSYAIDAPQAASKRQAEFLASRLCAREALRLQTGQASLPLPQAHSRAPRWPANSCGSMSHSHAICAAIVGNSKHWQSLGLDLEKPLSPVRAQRLAKTILTPAEHQHYLTLDDEQRALYLTLVFSFKESLFKALNPLTGTYFGFHDAQVLELSSLDTGYAQLRLCKDLSAFWRDGEQLQGQFSHLHGSVMTLVSVATAK